jgi:hypothetical protein
LWTLVADKLPSQVSGDSLGLYPWKFGARARFR